MVTLSSRVDGHETLISIWNAKDAKRVRLSGKGVNRMMIEMRVFEWLRCQGNASLVAALRPESPLPSYFLRHSLATCRDDSVKPKNSLAPSTPAASN